MVKLSGIIWRDRGENICGKTIPKVISSITGPPVCPLWRQPRLPPCLLVIVIASLVLIIRNSFEVSMNARIHQFGILPSIGASPGQIRICLMQEAAVLTVLPMIPGTCISLSSSCIGSYHGVRFFDSPVFRMDSRRKAEQDYAP